MAPSPPPRFHHRSTTPAGGGREDCWCEGATEALIEAWGERYVLLKRGNLRQKDWQEVADAVNEHQDALGRPRRTDIQCKNRIDTLKKKYKIEKARRGPSDWSFFSRLEELIGPAASAPASGSGSGTLTKHHAPKSEPRRGPQRPSPMMKVKNRSCSEPKPLGVVYPGRLSFRSRMNLSPGSSESSCRETDDGAGSDDGNNDEDDFRDEDERQGMSRFPEVTIPKKRRWDGFVDGDGGRDNGGGGGGGSGSGGSGSGVGDLLGELAKAIVKFGDIYERIESSKQQQMMEMERQKMEFAREMELQRMQMFMDTQLELEKKMKRPKYSSDSGKRS